MTTVSGRSLSRRQTEILDVLEGIFLTSGVRSVQVGELAASARCSRATLYEIAPSKEELFLVTLDRCLSRVEAAARAAGEAVEDLGDQIEAYFQENFAVMGEVGPAFAADAADYTPSLLRLAEHAVRAQAWVRERIEEGVRNRRFREIDAELAAALMLVTAERLTRPDVVALTHRPWTETLPVAVDLFLHGLVGPPQDPTIDGVQS